MDGDTQYNTKAPFLAHLGLAAVVRDDLEERALVVDPLPASLLLVGIGFGVAAVNPLGDDEVWELLEVVGVDADDFLGQAFVGRVQDCVKSETVGQISS